MVDIIFIEPSGEEHLLSVQSGKTLMACAVDHSIPGIAAECGGACTCATCHVYLDDSSLENIAKVSDVEESLLDFLENVGPNSRLSCQVIVTDSLDGMRVRIPEE